MLRQFLNGFVLEHAGGDDVYPPRESARHIGNRFPRSQSHVTGRKVNGLSVQVRHARLETDPCAQGGFFKQQRESARILPVQAALTGKVVLFQPRRNVERGAYLFG